MLLDVVRGPFWLILSKFRSAAATWQITGYAESPVHPCNNILLNEILQLAEQLQMSSVQIHGLKDVYKT